MYEYATVFTSWEGRHRESLLNRMAEEGWRLVQAIREGKVVYYIMERRASEEEVTPKEPFSFSYWEADEGELPFDLKVWEVPVETFQLGRLRVGELDIELERACGRWGQVYVGRELGKVHLCYSVGSIAEPRPLFCIRGAFIA